MPTQLILSKKNVKSTRSTSPVNLSVYKSTTARRTVSIPNPYSFICTVKYICDHRVEVFKLAKSENSESSVTFIHKYDNTDNTFINSDLARSLLLVKSAFRENLRNRIIISMGFKYRLSLDISSFMIQFIRIPCLGRYAEKKRLSVCFPRRLSIRA